MFHFPNLEWNKLPLWETVLKFWSVWTQLLIAAEISIEEYFANIPDSMTTLLLNGIFLEPWLLLGPSNFNWMLNDSLANELNST